MTPSVILASIILVLVIWGFLIYTISMLNSILRNVPQVGTFGKNFQIIQNGIRGIIHKKGTMIDLWSGSGKICRYFAREHDLDVRGYEVDFGNIILAKFLNLFIWRKPKYILQSFLSLNSEDFQDVDYVYIYLFPHLVEKIERNLVPRMKPGTKIIVNSFAFPNLKPVHVLEEKIYIYEI